MRSIAILLLLILNQPEIQYGRASHYDPNVMSHVIAVRQKSGELPMDLSMYDGAITVAECSDIGKSAIVCSENDCVFVIVADCASKSDRQSAEDSRSGWEWMRSENICVELSYPLAMRFGTVGRIKPDMRLLILEEAE